MGRRKQRRCCVLKISRVFAGGEGVECEYLSGWRGVVVGVLGRGKAGRCLYI